MWPLEIQFLSLYRRISKSVGVKDACVNPTLRSRTSESDIPTTTVLKLKVHYGSSEEVKTNAALEPNKAQRDSLRRDLAFSIHARTLNSGACMSNSLLGS